MTSLKRMVVPLLTILTIMVCSVMVGLSVHTLSQGLDKQVQCMERLIVGRQAPKIPGWYPSEKEEIAEFEVLGWEIKNSNATVCSDKYTSRLWREIRAFEWRQVLDFKASNPRASIAARSALYGTYREFRPHIYRCATTARYWFNPTSLWHTELVKVGTPVGRLQLYGPKEKCTPSVK